jgi:multiple sugar transport system substrate-binding protein
MKPARFVLLVSLLVFALGSFSFAVAQDSPVELLLWHMEQPPHRVARIQELLDEFNAANPGIVVRQEPQNWGEVYAKAPAALAAGNAPDLLFAIPDFVNVIKELGATQPVEEFVGQLQEEFQMYDWAIEPYTYDGHTWAVPLYNMAQSLWYHKSMFEEAGVTPPETWEEWQAAAEALTADGVYGVGLPASRSLYADQVVYDFMVNAGAQDIYDDEGNIVFDTPETVAAYDFYSTLWQYSPPDSTNWTWGEAEACFNSGTCAMVPQFTVITTYDQAGGDPADLGVLPLPRSGEAEENYTIAYVNGVMLLTEDEAKQEAAQTFLSWLFQPENYGRFLNMEPGLFLPVTETGSTADSFWDDPIVVKYREQVEQMIANSQNGMLFGFTEGNTFPSIASISAQNILAQVLQMVVVDGTSAADAVAQGQQMMEEAVGS